MVHIMSNFIIGNSSFEQYFLVIAFVKNTLCILLLCDSQFLLGSCDARVSVKHFLPPEILTAHAHGQAQLS